MIEFLPIYGCQLLQWNIADVRIDVVVDTNPVALERPDRAPHEANSNAGSEFNLRVGTFYTQLDLTLTIWKRKHCLIKGNHGNSSQERLNEMAATLIHSRQQRQPYAVYSPVQSEKNDQLFCMCESFTSDAVELITAYDLIESQKRPNSVSYYEHLIQVCAQHGLNESVARPFLEHQILTDFVLTNTDASSEYWCSKGFQYAGVYWYGTHFRYW